MPAWGRIICWKCILGDVRCASDMGEASNLRRIPTPLKVPSRGGDVTMAREMATCGMVTSLQGGGDAAELDWMHKGKQAEGTAAGGVVFPPSATVPTAGAK